MPVDRNSLRNIVINNNEKYDDILLKRGRYFIEQYATQKLVYPTLQQMRDITTQQHLWTVGDKYWKLAATYYEDPSIWWILAWFNKKPTEAHCKTGDSILIPYPLSTMYRYFGL